MMLRDLSRLQSDSEECALRLLWVTATIELSVEQRVHDLDGPHIEVVPVIDGVKLTDRVHRFGREAGFETRELSYGGLIPASFGSVEPSIIIPKVRIRWR
jgi:hypothetical protein